MMSSSSSDAKMQRLQMVFNKALQASIEGIDNSQLEHCFGNTTKTLGNNIQHIFIKKIAKVETNLQKTFEELCSQHDMEELFAGAGGGAGGGGDDGSSSSGDGGAALSKLVSDIQNEEMKQLNAAISKMENEIIKLTAEATKIHQNVTIEMASGRAESQKLASAAAQIS